MTFAANLDHNGIGLDLNAAEMDATVGSDNITLVAGGKSVIVDNDEPVIHRPGKPLDDERRHVCRVRNRDDRTLIGPVGIGEKWVAAFPGT